MSEWYSDEIVYVSQRMCILDQVFYPVQYLTMPGKVSSFFLKTKQCVYVCRQESWQRI